MSRSTRTLIAVILFVLAGFVIVNNLVLGAALGDWLLPLGLFVAALIFSLYPDTSAGAATHTEAEPAPLAAPEPMPTLAPPPAAPPVQAKAAPKPAEKPAASAQPDDLRKISGVGPKMQTALRAAGYDTFAKIAQASEDDLRAAVEAAGMRLAPNLDTWPAQARDLMK